MSCVVRIPAASVRRADPTPTPKLALRASLAKLGGGTARYASRYEHDLSQ